PAPTPGLAFDLNALPARLSYQSLKDRYEISFNFPVPAVDPHYRSKPAYYLTNLLGHEGDGSLHQHLKAEGWIESLAAGVSRLDAGNAALSVTIELTPAGREAIDEIGAALFGYIELLKSSEPEAWRYNEQAEAAELSFRFQEKSSATGFVSRTSPNMALYPAEEILVADYLMEGFDAALIKEYLSYLRADNVLIELSGPDLETDQVERWFQVPYRLETDLQLSITAAPGTMHLPEPNPFLPDAVALTESRTAPPALAINRPGAELWLAPDVEFRVPRANQTYTLAIEGGLATPRDLALAQLYARLVNDALNPYAYPAMLAGLSYNIGTSPAGFRLSVAGYSDKQTVLIERVLDTFTALTIDAERFDLYLEELERNWRNFRNERPYTQTYAALSHTVLSTSFTPEELAQAAAGLTAADLEAWRAERFDRFAVVGLAHGNLDAEALAAVDELFADSLTPADIPLLRPELTLVEEALLLEIPVEHNDASMVLYVQDADASFEARARSALTSQILRQSFFSSLRTEQQLGYVVTMTNRTLRDRGALVFIIQSPVASPADLEAATLEFMQAELPKVAELDEATFEQFKAGLVSRLTERAKNLRERSGRYLADLDAEVTTFDSQDRIAAIVNSLTLDDVTDYLTETMT
ncbi:MAG: insulinase family protein, partial [Pseudomonadota bacterium]